MPSLRHAARNEFKQWLGALFAHARGRPKVVQRVNACDGNVKVSADTQRRRLRDMRWHLRAVFGFVAVKTTVSEVFENDVDRACDNHAAQ